ncbi:hypothetical protein WMF37_27305 [Sorangium sp. So ce291]
MTAGVLPLAASRSSHPATSSGAPLRQVANVGEASRVLSSRASACRSFGAKNSSTSRAPTVAIGGSARSASSSSSPAGRPPRSRRSARCASSTCSRLRAGSGSRPTSRSRSDSEAESASRAASSSSSQSDEGASSADSTWIGSPAVVPGVSRRGAMRARSAATSAGPRPEEASPARHRAASSPATSAVERPSRAAAEGSIHGSNSAGESSGNVKSRLGRSPFTSTMSTGTPERSASSTRTMTSPVLPLPVMPTTTPWVTRWCAGSSNGRAAAAPGSPWSGRERPSVKGRVGMAAARDMAGATSQCSEREGARAPVRGRFPIGCSGSDRE